MNRMEVVSLTFNRANCGPLNAVRGRFSSFALLPFSIGGFFGRLVRGPTKYKFIKNKLLPTGMRIPLCCSVCTVHVRLLRNIFEAIISIDHESGWHSVDSEMHVDAIYCVPGNKINLWMGEFIECVCGALRHFSSTPKN